MSELEVRIVRLEPVHVAAVRGFGASPEQQAWQKLAGWARAKGLLKDPKQHRVFGFNNPDPSPGSPNYGYEFWIVVSDQVQPEGEVEIKDFAGGLYAVTRCQGTENINPTWKRLVAWLEDSPHKRACHQWLEEHLPPLDTPLDEANLLLDLYAPIAG